MKTKRPVVLALLLVIVMMSSTISYASFQDVPKSATYTTAVERLVNLGIFSSTTDSKFLPGNIVTREQFAKIVVIASGLEELASTLTGTSAYGDVSPSSATNGYINAVLKKGYLTGLADGKFHPTDAITYAQVCTVLVKMLGYTNEDVAGVWPTNYIEKAKSIGITSGISLKSSSTVTRSNLAIMLDKLLDTNIKSSNASEANKTFITSVGLETTDSVMVYSKPEIVTNYNTTASKIGSISLDGISSIVRNTYDNTVSPATSTIGESIVKSEIKNKDVVYLVTDKRNSKKYILVIDNKITGEVTSILPDKYTPSQLQIDDVNYSLSKYMDLAKLNGSSGAYNVGDTVTALLGYDGKVMDVATTMDEYNEDYAVVLNYYSESSTVIDDYGTINYFVKLLRTDGSKKTYRTAKLSSSYTGEIVKFDITKEADEDDDYQTVKIESLTYLGNSEYVVDKENRMIGSDYVTDNVVIFNVVNKIYNGESTVRIMNWSDMPNGKISPDKIKYMSKVGDFGDINVLYVDNILNENVSYGMVTNIVTQKAQGSAAATTTYTINIGGKNYSALTDVAGISIGSVVEVKMSGSSLLSVTSVESAWGEASSTSAIDSERIRINGIVYRFSNTASIFFKDSEGNYVRKGTNDIIKDKTYGRISVYLNNNPVYGGEVSMVVVTPY